MTTQRRTAIAALTLLGLAIYFTGGAYALLWLNKNDGNVLEHLIILALFLPIIAMMAGWAAMEVRMGRSLLFRAIPDRGPITRAQRRTERTANVLLIALVLFLSLSPATLPLLGHGEVRLSNLAPILVWAWIVYTTGIERLRRAVIFFIRGLPEESQVDPGLLYDFALGMIVSHSGASHGEWKAKVSIDEKHGFPKLTLLIESSASKTVTTIEATPHEQMALMIILTKNGDPYLLPAPFVEHIKCDLSDHTPHELMEAAAKLHKAKDRAPQELVSL